VYEIFLYIFRNYKAVYIIKMLKSMRMGRARHVASTGEKRNAYRSLMGKPEGKRPLGRSRCRWNDNIKMYLTEIGRGCMDWIHLAQDVDQWSAVVNTATNLRVK
jgi:hypothetical protein